MIQNSIKSYDELIESIKLINIILEEFSFKRFIIQELKGKQSILVNFETKDSIINDKIDENVFIQQPVSFILHSENDSSEKIFELNAIYKIVYKLEKNVEIELISEYVKNNIPKLLHPYLREIISSSIQKSGLPPYVLPLYENL